MKDRIYNFFTKLYSFDAEVSSSEKNYFRFLELFVGFYTLKFMWVWGFEIQNSVEVLLPLGIANYIDVSFMFSNNLSVYSAAAATVFFVLGFFRFKPAWTYWLTMALFHLQYASRYCLGEISHGSNFIGTSLLLIAFAFTVFNNNENYARKFALGNIFFFVGFGYTSAALCKIIGTGPTWFSGGHLQLWIAERSIDTMSKFGAFSPNLLQEMVINHQWIASVTLLFGLVAELFGFLIWFKGSRYYIMPVLIGMHIGIFMSMNILFLEYILQLSVLMIPFFLNRKTSDQYSQNLRFSTSS